jgi:hypothetical protein
MVCAFGVAFFVLVCFLVVCLLRVTIVLISAPNEHVFMNRFVALCSEVLRKLYFNYERKCSVASRRGMNWGARGKIAKS